MKRVLFIILCLLGTALWSQAKAPWSQDEYVVSAWEEGSAVNLSDVTLLPLIVEGKPIRVRLQLDNEPTPQATQYLQEWVTRAYNEWFLRTAQAITQRGRREEFKDVLPILERGVTLQFVQDPGVREDLRLTWKDDLELLKQVCDCDCLGCMYGATPEEPMEVIVADGGNFSTLLHEIGHTLGMDEAYKDKQTFQAHSHRSLELVDYSVMDDDDQPISMDDADGLINLIDFYQLQRIKRTYPSAWCKHLSSRVREGWDSLFVVGEKPLDRYRMGTSEKILPDEMKCPPQPPVKRPKVKRNIRPPVRAAAH